MVREEKQVREGFEIPHVRQHPWLYVIWGAVAVALAVLIILSVLRSKNIISFYVNEQGADM